jgi:hypothetical protein
MNEARRTTKASDDEEMTREWKQDGNGAHITHLYTATNCVDK